MRRGWRAICKRCGFEYANWELQKEWNGLMVCKNCWEPRHSQDFVRGKTDRQTPPWTRPPPADVFISVIYVEAGYVEEGYAV